MGKSYYHGTIKQFRKDNEGGLYMDHMCESAGLSPQVETSEIVSWRNNATAIARLINRSNLPEDVYMAFEYSAPVAGRIDWMLFGKDANGIKNIIVVELKQWSNDVTVCEFGANLVNVYTGHQYQEVEHPSAQVRGYCNSLRAYIDFLNQEDTKLTGIAYCYNYSKDRENVSLLGKDFSELLEEYPLYTGDDEDKLSEILSNSLALGGGEEIYTELINTPEMQTPELMRSVANIVLENDTFFNLLGDQSIAYEKFTSLLQDSLKHPERKNVLIVKGGPGTGKTVVALKILAEQAAQGRTVYYTTRSTALKTQLKEKLRRSRLCDNQMASNIILDIFKFKPCRFKESEIDVLIIDEAHRVQNNSNDKSDRPSLVRVEYDGKRAQSAYCPLTQDISLMYCAKVTIFFIDDQQAVRGGEIGLSNSIHDSANHYQERIQEQIEKFQRDFSEKKPDLEESILKKEAEYNEVLLSTTISDEKRKKKLSDLDDKIKAQKRELRHEDCCISIQSTINKVRVVEQELRTQFRCKGAEHLAPWLEQVLYIPAENISIRLPKNEYDFRIVDDVQKLYESIVNISNEGRDVPDSEHVTARMIAGWCWPWEAITDENGDLREEIVITNNANGKLFTMKWETNENVRVARAYRNQYPKDAHHWAADPRGVRQMGCAFSAQGFEFDYVGVVLGPDITYDEDGDCLVTHRERNKDSKVCAANNMNADQQIRNIYRILMTRGKKGCYVYCCDPGVSAYLKRFMEE